MSSFKEKMAMFNKGASSTTPPPKPAAETPVKLPGSASIADRMAALRRSSIKSTESPSADAVSVQTLSPGAASNDDTMESSSPSVDSSSVSSNTATTTTPKINKLSSPFLSPSPPSSSTQSPAPSSGSVRRMSSGIASLQASINLSGVNPFSPKPTATSPASDPVDQSLEAKATSSDSVGGSGELTHLSLSRPRRPTRRPQSITAVSGIMLSEDEEVAKVDDGEVL